MSIKATEIFVYVVMFGGFLGSFAVMLWIHVSNNFDWTSENIALGVMLAMLFGLPFLIFGSVMLRALNRTKLLRNKS